MAIYLIRSEFTHVSGLAEDMVTSNLHFSTSEGVATAAIGQALVGHVAAAYETAGPSGGLKPSEYLSAELSRVVKPVGKAYEDNGIGLMGSPLWTGSWAGFSAAWNGDALPSEVAVCLSYRKEYGSVLEEAPDGADADALVDRPRSRQRGRLYFGPLGNHINVRSAGAPCRPVTGLQNALLDMADFLASPTNPTLTAVTATFGVRGKNGFQAVDTAWVDNAFDTQRRRGVDATSRITRVL